MFDVVDLNFGPAAPVCIASLSDRVGDAPLTTAERVRAFWISKLIKELPDSGSVVIVHSPTVVAVWRQQIHEMRGPAVAAATRVLAAPALRDEKALTAGLDVPVFRDAFVDESREHRRAIAQAWRL